MRKLMPKDRGEQVLLFERPDNGWRPEMPPDLAADEHIGFDWEYKPGSNPTKDQPVSFSIYVPSVRQGWHVPFGYHGGGNLDEEACKLWYKTNLRDRHFYGLNLKAELHQTHNWGLEPDALNMHPHDVAFGITLLNEDQGDFKKGGTGFSLAALAELYLPEGERKVTPSTIDPGMFYLAHSGEVAERAISDSFLAWRLHEVTAPLIQAEELEKVLDLENRVILPVVDMERNGALIDRTKLELWDYQVDERINTLFMDTYRETGLGVNPDSRPEMIRLFAYLGIPLDICVGWDEDATDQYGNYGAFVQNFSEEALLNVVLKTSNKTVARLLELRKFKSLSTKYLKKYLAKIDSNNILRFTLHQLRQDTTGSLKGTATGRFSCGGSQKDYRDHRGINIQQVPKAEDQIETLGPDFCIRELFIAEPGAQVGASDASQIEFRIFAHYANAKSILEAYARDPMTDFHMLVTKTFRPELLHDQDALDSERKEMKHNNFGKIYRMGRRKLARRLGRPCLCPINWSEKEPGSNRNVNQFWNNSHHEPDCRAREANDICDEYDDLFPEAGEVCDKAESAAKKQNFVRTLYGRRRHFRDGKNYHKAFNSADQGSAADIFKEKLCLLYRLRKELGIKLRMPVHDEFVFDIWREIEEVQRVLDEQCIQLKVPILWESGIGPNWKVANFSDWKNPEKAAKKEAKAVAKYWKGRV